MPDLMTGTGIVTDPNSLATLGTLVRGVAADGVARVVVAAPASHVGDVVTLTVINDQGSQSNSSQLDGGIGAIGDSSNSKQQSVRVAAQDSEEGPMAFAVYYPPPDFSRGSQDNQVVSRTVYIQANLPGANTPAFRKPLSILRPPVVLVHDMWEGPADWDNFTPLADDARFFIRRASYNAVLGNQQITASIPAYPNTNLALARESALVVWITTLRFFSRRSLQYVNEFRSLQNAAAAQADVVVHGMGGVIARALSQLPNYNAQESFSSGNVDKLITIGTPHLGTPLATALLRNENTCFADVLASTGEFSFSSATVDGASVSGAIGDLQGDGFGGGLSPALARIQQSSGDTAPVGVLAGVMTNSNLTGLSNSFSVAGFIRSACNGTLANLFNALGWQIMFLQPSDGMVPLLSQWAGTFGTEYNGIVHSAGLEELGFTLPVSSMPSRP